MVSVINVRHIDHLELSTVEYVGDVYVKWTTIVHGKCLLNVRYIDHLELTTVEYVGDVYIKWSTIVHGKCLL